jgi:hypothetical protein
MRTAHSVIRLAATLLSVAVLAVSLGISFATPAHAETLTIIPPRVTTAANPGDTVRQYLRIRNDSETNITYTTDIENFTARGDEGDVDFVDDADNSSFSMAKWMTVEPSRFTIPTGQEVRLEVIIKVPTNAEPGGHFASVIIKRAVTENSNVTGAQIESRVGSLFLMSVAGNVTEKAKVDVFRAQQAFYQTLPATLELRTINEGNVHIQPRGTITVTDMFGRKVTELPLTQANVLPGAARIARTTWDTNGFFIGRYTATVVAEYATNTNDNTPRTLTASTTFIVFPLWLIWILLGVIAVVGSFIVFRKQIRRFINQLTAD